MNYSIGSYGVSNHQGVCSPVYVVLNHRPEKIDHQYLDLILSNPSYQSYAQSYGVGILAHRCTIGWDILRKIKIAVPTIPEQQAIARRAHRETTRIDALIEKKTRFIELLKEKRQALITQAVTKGLDPNVKMKDSGVEWLGEVPEHWGVKKIKFLCNLVTKRATTIDEGRPYLGLENVESGTGKQIETAKKGRQQDDSTVGVFNKGDVLYGKLRPYLMKSVSVDTDGYCSTEFLILRAENQVQSELLHQWFLTIPLTKQIEAGCEGAKMPRADWEHVGGIALPMPPPDEAKELLAQLKKRIERIERLSDVTQKSINLLQERRSALITAAVTGQIDLRDAA